MNTKRKLTVGFIHFEKRYEQYKVNENYDEATVIYYYAKIIFFVLTFIISIIVVVEIILYVLPYYEKTNTNNVQTFSIINVILNFFTKINLAFISTFVFAIYTFFLFFSILIGYMKFNQNFMVYTDIYPLKKQSTSSVSFLFNILLLLIASVSISNYLAYILRDYVSITEFSFIFNFQLKKIYLLNSLLKSKIYDYAFLVSIFLSLISLFCNKKPSLSIDPKKIDLEMESIGGSMNTKLMIAKAVL